MDESVSSRIVTSRGEFQDAVRYAIARAADEGCRQLFLSDSNFADWPLGERAVVDDLTRWAYAHRQLTMLARDYDDLSRRHTRWVTWRRQWAHVVACRGMSDNDEQTVPSLLVAPGVVTLRVIDPHHFRAVVSHDAADEIQALELLDGPLQRSIETFPATVLGL